ncbi:MAG TPA: hypothetical protein VLF90_01600 [Patescibacteria group bacterium]|nr:hypothetical protein [Patescibacteria group bacterium]
MVSNQNREQIIDLRDVATDQASGVDPQISSTEGDITEAGPDSSKTVSASSSVVRLALESEWDRVVLEHDLQARIGHR